MSVREDNAAQLRATGVGALPAAALRRDTKRPSSDSVSRSRSTGGIAAWTPGAEDRSRFRDRVRSESRGPPSSTARLVRGGSGRAVLLGAHAHNGIARRRAWSHALGTARSLTGG